MTKNIAVSRFLQEMIDREIENDEKINWIDQPIARFFSIGTIVAFLFGIIWTAFALVWTCGAAGFKIPDFNKWVDFFPLFGVPFILVGLVMLLSPFWMYKNTLKTVYLITNKRAIIFERGMFTTTIQSFLPNKLQDIYREEKRNGSGNIIIVNYRNKNDDNLPLDESGFFQIKNVKEVEGMLKTLGEKYINNSNANFKVDNKNNLTD